MNVVWLCHIMLRAFQLGKPGKQPQILLLYALDKCQFGGTLFRLFKPFTVHCYSLLNRADTSFMKVDMNV